MLTQVYNIFKIFKRTQIRILIIIITQSMGLMCTRTYIIVDKIHQSKTVRARAHTCVWKQTAQNDHPRFAIICIIIFHPTELRTTSEHRKSKQYDATTVIIIILYYIMFGFYTCAELIIFRVFFLSSSRDIQGNQNDK